MAGAIAERLTAEDKSPTLAAIRAELGGDSFTTIKETLQNYTDGKKIPPLYS